MSSKEVEKTAQQEFIYLLDWVEALQNEIAELKFNIEDFIKGSKSSEINAKDWRWMREWISSGPAVHCLSNDIVILLEERIESLEGEK